MGSAASLAADSTIDLSKAKESALDKWTPEIEKLFASKLSERGTISLRDARCVFPQLFYGESISMENAIEHATIRNVLWNDDLRLIFESNSSANEPRLMTLESWKSLVPTLFETDDERADRIKKEFLAILAARSEGTVVINYQMYNEQFPISENTLTAARIDEDYGLTDVMPGCRMRLSTIESKARTLYQNAYDGRQAPWVREEPEGVFKDLLAGETYYCIVFEDAAQYARDLAQQQARVASCDAVKDDPGKGRVEGCSCLFGNPCVDQYICKDWDNRCAVAKKNGWKGF